MFKKILSVLAAAALCASMAACGASGTSSAASEPAPGSSVADSTAETTAEEASSGALRVAGLKGPTTMGLVNLMAGEQGENYEFTMYGAADEIVPLLVKGELDAAAVPAYLAATMYQ